jgi:hypothetical protein
LLGFVTRSVSSSAKVTGSYRGSHFSDIGFDDDNNGGDGNKGLYLDCVGDEVTGRRDMV